MKLGMALGNFAWPLPASDLGAMISGLARQADEAGFRLPVGDGPLLPEVHALGVDPGR